MLWENHWRYCRLLEQELDEISVYIELSKNNFSCYSIKLMRLINSAVSEFEVVAKEICSQLQPEDNVEYYNISKIRDVILSAYPNLTQTEVRVLDMNYVFCPFLGWDQESRLNWWDTYNKLKHDRNNYFERANLQQAIYSVAVLKVMVMILRNYTKAFIPGTTWTLIQVQEIWQESKNS